MSDVVSVSPPTMTVEGFEQVLVAASSPAAAVAGACYEAICQYGVDPAFALAIFCHESSYGKKGVAVRSQGWGNLRAGEFCDAIVGNFAYYYGPDGWIRSAKDTARLLKKYADGRMGFMPCRRHAEHVTPLSILEHYAPSEDGNKPRAYAEHVERLVKTFRENWPVASEPGQSTNPPGQVSREEFETLVQRVQGLEADLGEVEAALNSLKRLREQPGVSP